MVPAETIPRATLATTLAVSAFASIEPSPYEFMFAALVTAEQVKRVIAAMPGFSDRGRKPRLD
jgi:hypothetical protein